MKIKGKFKFSDMAMVELTSRRLTDEGFLVASVAFTKVGVQQYSASDLGIDGDEVFSVLRPPETVFHRGTIDSLEGKPVTDEHPESNVTPDNYRALSVGHVGDSIAAIDKERLGGKIFIHDKAIIEQVASKEKEQVSIGYTCEVVPETGVYEGEEYQLKFDGPMLCNHVACVEAGRCGDTVRILDEKGETGVKKDELIKAMKAKGMDVSKAEEKDKETFSAEDVLDILIPKKKDEEEEAEEKKKDNGEEAEEAEEKKKDEDKDEAKKKDSADPVASKEAMHKAKALADAEINDRINRRVSLLRDTADLLPADFKADDKSDKEVLVAALGEKYKDRDESYLMGVLEVTIADRQKAGEHMASFNDGSGANLNNFEVLSGMQQRAAERKQKS